MHFRILHQQPLLYTYIFPVHQGYQRRELGDPHDPVYCGSSHYASYHRSREFSDWPLCAIHLGFPNRFLGRLRIDLYLASRFVFGHMDRVPDPTRYRGWLLDVDSSSGSPSGTYLCTHGNIPRKLNNEYRYFPNKTSLLELRQP